MNISRRRLLLFSWLVPFTALAEPVQPTHEFTLNNGLKVVVREDHRAPVVTSQLWIKVGSSDEPPGQSGLSHALEHMLYKGSSKVCAGEASAILNKLGASANAFTNKDVTTYHQTLQPYQLGVAFELMADMMSTALLRAEDFIPELAVIQEERRLYEDEPNATAQERLTSIALPASSYGAPVVGWMHDLQRLKVDDLHHWYQTRYAPANATLIIVGDVTLEQVKTLAERYFGGLPAKTFVTTRKSLELAEPGERKIILHQAIPAPRLIMSFNVPSLTTAENRRTAHALRLLDTLLAGSNSGRLTKQLQFTDRLFSSTSSNYNPLYRGDSLFTLNAQLNAPSTVSLDEAQARIWALLDELKATPPDSVELERARTRLIARQIYDRDSITNQGYQLGALESIGQSWRLVDEDANELKQVTPADIQHAAQTYLTRQRLSIAHVLVEKTHE
jgi:zinc protease